MFSFNIWYCPPGPVNTFLSWTGFLPFSRLTYCIFLTHSALQTMTSFSTKTLFYIDDVTVVSNTKLRFPVPTGYRRISSVSCRHPVPSVEGR